MFFQDKLADFFARMGVGVLIGVVFAWAISEGAYLLLNNKESVQSEAQRYELVIPYGTADRVEQGVVTGILLDDLVLAEGDILVVKNEDTVPHQLGPLWVPPSTSSVLELNNATTYSYDCSFQPDRNIGLEVRPRVQGSDRLQGILSIALPSGMMLGVYSYLVPERKKKG